MFIRLLHVTLRNLSYLFFWCRSVTPRIHCDHQQFGCLRREPRLVKKHNAMTPADPNRSARSRIASHPVLKIGLSHTVSDFPRGILQSKRKCLRRFLLHGVSTDRANKRMHKSMHALMCRRVMGGGCVRKVDRSSPKFFGPATHIKVLPHIPFRGFYWWCQVTAVAEWLMSQGSVQSRLCCPSIVFR